MVTEKINSLGNDLHQLEINAKGEPIARQNFYLEKPGDLASKFKAACNQNLKASDDQFINWTMDFNLLLAYFVLDYYNKQND